MTVGQELERITDLRLFHNHMSIEPVRHFFPFGSPSFNRLVTLFRFELFKEVAASDLHGMIFTFVWAFDLESEESYVDSIIEIFEGAGAEIYYVELAASLDARLLRNRDEKRLQQKPSKRDVEESEKILLEHEQHHRFNTLPDEFQRPNYLLVNNTKRSPAEVAQLIKETFTL